MPLTKEQASQIDWEALLTRLVALRCPLAHWLVRVSEPPHVRDDGLSVSLHDILVTLEYIERCLAPSVEVKSDATT